MPIIIKGVPYGETNMREMWFHFCCAGLWSIPNLSCLWSRLRKNNAGHRLQTSEIRLHFDVYHFSMVIRKCKINNFDNILNGKCKNFDNILIWKCKFDNISYFYMLQTEIYPRLRIHPRWVEPVLNDFSINSEKPWIRLRTKWTRVSRCVTKTYIYHVIFSSEKVLFISDLRNRSR